MKFIIFLTPFFVVNTFAATAFADRAQCEKELSSLMTNVETDIRSMPKQDAQVHKLCIMWLYERAQYESAKEDNNGEDPCPSNSSDWKKILGKLIGGYSNAKSICNDSNVCSNGCGKALSIIRSGGSTAQALKAIPNE